MSEQIVEAIFHFKNQKHYDEFIAQIFDGFGEEYVNIERQPVTRTGIPVYYIEMQDGFTFRDSGWHIEQLVSSGLWMEVQELKFDDRGDAISYTIKAENAFPDTKFRVKEDYELY